MKKLLYFVLIIILFAVSMRIGNKFMVEYLMKEKAESVSINPILSEPKEKTYITDSGELYSEAIFEKIDGVDLTEEMDFNQDANLHYKIITNLDEYNKYKDKVTLPEMTEGQFQNYFAIIIFNENPRAIDETDLEIIKIYLDESATHVVMKQKENANAFMLNNVFFAIAEKSQLTDTIVIDINVEDTF